jgi:Protein of unknown function (DUF2934)
MEPSLEQRIRERAYEIWNASGREDGRADEHWFSAVRELLETPRGQPATAKTEGRTKIPATNKPKRNRPRMMLSRWFFNREPRQLPIMDLLVALVRSVEAEVLDLPVKLPVEAVLSDPQRNQFGFFTFISF